MPHLPLPACSGPFSPPKLPTPRRGLPAAQLGAVKVPPLKLPISGSDAASTSTAALAQDENVGGNMFVTAPADKAAQAGGKKKGAMRFLPGGKKVGGWTVAGPAASAAAAAPVAMPVPESTALHL